MLELRPCCENCRKRLPPESNDAMICSFECTFCRDCVRDVLSAVCPNCGGDFVPRPIRPIRNLKGDNYLGKYPAAERERHRPVDAAEHRDFAARIAKIPPTER